MTVKESKCLFHLEGKNIEGCDWVVPISTNPFVIGRGEACNLRLHVGGISRVHAQIKEKGGVWFISDCGSTNGTFVNRQRLTDEQIIKHGDVLQLADMHFTITEIAALPERTHVTNPHARQFERMMAEKAVSPHFQPIVRLSDCAILGHEVLGRIHYEGLPESPMQMFQIARKLDRDIELSQLFINHAFAQANRLGLPGVLFFNMLPAEVDPESILVSLGRVRKDFPSLRLAMELPESAGTNVAMIRRMRQILNDLKIYLIYDDFGSGQARLAELMEVPPDVIKFDISMIHNIDTRPESSQSILAALVKMAKQAGIKTLAEGVETKQEANACRRFGFEMAQGYYFGRPKRLADNCDTTQVAQEI